MDALRVLPGADPVEESGDAHVSFFGFAADLRDPVGGVVVGAGLVPVDIGLPVVANPLVDVNVDRVDVGFGIVIAMVAVAVAATVTGRR